MAAGADAAVRVTTTEPVRAEATATADKEASAAKEEPALEKQPKKSRKTSASTKRSAPGTVKVHNSMTGETSHVKVLMTPCLQLSWQVFSSRLLQQELCQQLLALSPCRKGRTSLIGNR